MTACFPKRGLVLAGIVLASLSLGVAMPAAGQPAPPPIEQLRTDCTRPQYASDTLICGDAELRAIDAEVATLASVPVALAATAIWEDQASWIRRRSLCAFNADHRACLLAAYAERRAILAGGSAATTIPLLCDGRWQGLAISASTPVAGQPVVLRENNLLLGVAMPESRRAPPPLAWRAAGRGMKLQAQDGRQFKCRPAPG